MTRYRLTAPLVATWLALVSPLAWAQGPLLRFDRVSIDQGLSQSTVFSIAQDEVGFMWFGTQDGLNRYDGHNFVVYRQHPTDPNSLSDNNIVAMYADSRAGLWVGTEGGGLNRLDLETGAVERHRHNPADPSSLPHDWVTAIVPSVQGGLWVGTDGGGVGRMVGRGRLARFEPLLEAPGQPLCGARIASLLATRNKQLWIGTFGDGLCRLDIDSETLVRFQGNPPDPTSLGDDTIRALHEDSSGVVWVGSMAGLHRFEPETQRFERFSHEPAREDSLSNDYVYAILEDRDRNLWVGTQSGLNLLKPTEGTFTRYSTQPSRPESISGNRIESLFEDRSGLLWVGTGSGGLSKLNLRKTQFELVTPGAGDSGSLSNRVVWSILPGSHGDLWVGTERGLNHSRMGSPAFTQYVHNPADHSSLSNNNARAVIEDHRGVIWVGTDGGGLNRVRGAGRGFDHFRHDPQDARSLSSNRVVSLYEDRSGALWVGTRGGGACRLDVERRGFDRLGVGEGTQGLPNAHVYSILEDQAGVLWFGTLGGLSRYDPETGVFRHYRHDPRDPSSLSNDGVGVLFEDHRRQLWVGTDSGLNRLLPNESGFARYTTADGLPNDFVYGILQDRQGFLWLSTNRGLSRMDVEQGSFRNFDVNDGLQSNEFNAGARAMDDLGRLYFGGVNGYNVFLPDRIRINPQPPPVAITAFRALDEDLLPLTPGRTTTISYEQTMVMFEFAALDYAAPEKNRYAYMLEGFDREWVRAGTRRYASYTNLDGGEYSFRVKAANSDGVWNDGRVEVRFRVTSPPWLSGWAFVGYALLLAAAVFATVRFKTRTEARVLTERLRRLTSSLTQTLDLDEVVERLLNQLVEFVPYETASVHLMSEQGWQMKGTPRRRSRHAHAGREGSEQELRAKVVKSGEAVYLANPESARTEDGPSDAMPQCVLGIPLLVQDRLEGVVMLWGAPLVRFGRRHIDMAVTVVNQAGFAIQNARLFHRISQLAITDDLTGVANRRHFFDLAGREHSSALRHSRSISIIMLDIDHFKRVNDTYGHTAGDELLRLVAEHCRACLRQTDIVARYGGEEFVMLLPETDMTATLGVAERICDTLAGARMRIDGQEIFGLTASLGVAGALARDEDLISLVRRADKALYEAKRAGRNRVVAA